MKEAPGSSETSVLTRATRRNRRQVPPKRRFLQDPHGVTSQKTPFFIVTAVNTSNLTSSARCLYWIFQFSFRSVNYALNPNRETVSAQWTVNILKWLGALFYWCHSRVEQWMAPIPTYNWIMKERESTSFVIHSGIFHGHSYQCYLLSAVTATSTRT
jgi:hypothetical protein